MFQIINKKNTYFQRIKNPPSLKLGATNDFFIGDQKGVGGEVIKKKEDETLFVCPSTLPLSAH